MKKNNMGKARRAKELQLRQRARKTYKNKDWMFDHYCIQEICIDDIAKLCKVGFDDIWNSLKKLGIPRISDVGSIKWRKWVEIQKKKGV